MLVKFRCHKVHTLQPWTHFSPFDITYASKRSILTTWAEMKKWWIEARNPWSPTRSGIMNSWLTYSGLVAHSEVISYILATNFSSCSPLSVHHVPWVVQAAPCVWNCLDWHCNAIICRDKFRIHCRITRKVQCLTCFYYSRNWIENNWIWRFPTVVYSK